MGASWLRREATRSPGVSLVAVLVLVVVMLPAIAFFSTLGQARLTEAQNFHLRASTESVAWSALQNAIDLAQHQPLDDLGEQRSGTLADASYQFVINKTGSGFANEKIYQVFASCQQGQFTYTFMTHLEKFPPVAGIPANDPGLVVTHDIWGTPEPVNPMLVSDCTAVENERGGKVLAWQQVVDFEVGKSEAEFRAHMLARGPALPPLVRDRWAGIVEVLVQHKISVP